MVGGGFLETGVSPLVVIEGSYRAGRQARMRTSKTRQSLPPLYERDSSSGLAVMAWLASSVNWRGGWLQSRESARVSKCAYSLIPAQGLFDNVD